MFAVPKSRDYSLQHMEKSCDMLQGGWQHQQPQQYQPQGNLQPPFFPGQNGFPQQYALVPLNGSSGMMNGPQQHGTPPVGPLPGFGHPAPGMGSPQMMGGPGFAPGMNGFGCVQTTHDHGMISQHDHH